MIGKANESTVRRTLKPFLEGMKGEEGLEKVIAFMGRFQPEKKRRKSTGSARVGLFDAQSAVMGHEVQIFYDEFRASLSPLQVGDEESEEMFERFEREAEKATEAVEEIITDLLYDRSA